MCLVVITSTAQDISGRVIDEQAQPMPFVNVVLVNRADSAFIAGAITKGDGTFIISTDKQDGLLKVSSVGYKIRYLDARQGNVGDIQMLPDTQTLSEVVVKADKVIKKSDGMTVIPQKGLLKLSTDGFDVIYGIMIPGLDVDRQRGSVTRLGQEVAVYINGEKASNAELRNIKPGSIVRIDYIDIPSGKFINDPVSLNIITRSSTNGTYYAFDDTQYIGYMRNTFNATAQWNLEHLKVSLFAGNDLSNFGNAGSREREEYGFPGRSVLRSTDILDNRHKNDNQYLQLNVTKSASTYNMGIKVSAVRDEDPFQVVSGKVTVDDSGDKASRFLSEARSSRSFYPEVNAFGNFVLGQGQMLSANVSFSYGDNRYNDDIQEEDYRSLSNVNEDIWELKNFLSYSKTVKSQKFSLVMKDNYTRSNVTREYFRLAT